MKPQTPPWGVGPSVIALRKPTRPSEKGTLAVPRDLQFGKSAPMSLQGHLHSLSSCPAENPHQVRPENTQQTIGLAEGPSPTEIGGPEGVHANGSHEIDVPNGVPNTRI